jgi:serine/threonine protein kinase
MSSVSYEVLSILGRGGFGEVWLARAHGEAGFTKHVALNEHRRHDAAPTLLQARLDQLERP